MHCVARLKKFLGHSSLSSGPKAVMVSGSPRSTSKNGAQKIWRRSFLLEKDNLKLKELQVYLEEMNMQLCLLAMSPSPRRAIISASKYASQRRITIHMWDTNLLNVPPKLRMIWRKRLRDKPKCPVQQKYHPVLPGCCLPTWSYQTSIF